MGYHLAWPDAEITGVDIRPQKRYPFAFVQGDALDYLRAHGHEFDFVHASPPCQRYIRSGLVNKARTVDLVPPTRVALKEWGGPWVMENVPGAPLRAGLLLCGSMFGLRIRRHRLFEANWPLPFAPASCQHHHQITGVYGNAQGQRGAARSGHMLPSTLDVWSREMGIDWLTTTELAQAIPPAYTAYLAQFAPVAREAAPTRAAREAADAA